MLGGGGGGCFRASPNLTGQKSAVLLCWYVACSSLFCPLEHIVRGQHVSMSTRPQLSEVRTNQLSSLIERDCMDNGRYSQQQHHMGWVGLDCINPSIDVSMRSVSQQRSSITRKQPGGQLPASHCHGPAYLQPGREYPQAVTMRWHTACRAPRIPSAVLSLGNP